MDAYEGHTKLKKDIGTLGLLFLLVFPKTLIVFLLLAIYMWGVA